MLHKLLRYLGLAAGATGLPDVTLNHVFKQAQAANPTLWAQSSADIPTRQAKFEEFCLWLAPRYPTTLKAQRALLEATIVRLELGLREAGVGDMGVSRETRTLAAALNGRLNKYIKIISLDDLLKAAASHSISPHVATQVWPHLKAAQAPAPAKKTLPRPKKEGKSPLYKPKNLGVKLNRK